MNEAAFVITIKLTQSKSEDSCEGRLSSKVPRERWVKLPSLTRLAYKMLIQTTSKLWCNMNKKQLVREVARLTGFSFCLSKKVVDCFVQTITSELEQGRKISLKDFGAFCNVKRHGKSYFDIQSNKIKMSSPKNVVKFIPYKELKKYLSPNVIQLHSENDGSLGNCIELEHPSFTYQKTIRRKTCTSNYTPQNGKQNLGKRFNRRQELTSLELVFEANFVYDKFQGEADHETFPSQKVPLKGSPILLPQKDMIGATIGVMEPVLLESLRNLCKELKDVCILENVKLPVLNRNYSYHPDVCLYWKQKNIYVDIEVDEPYDILSRQPIHYMGNGDLLRDRYFIRNGWCVIRFAEQQVHDNVKGVTNYIKRVLSWLTEDDNISFDENSLDPIERWSYEQAETMASDNIREHYLGLPDYVPTDDEHLTDTDYACDAETPVFIKPSEDILPIPVDSQCISILDEIKKSKAEYFKVVKTNGYQWIYTRNSIETIILNGKSHIKGDSPLGISRSISLDEIEELVPLQNLYSDVHWDDNSGNIETLRKIVYDAIANGKPIWMAYDSINSGYGTRFLTNLAYFWHPGLIIAPHIGLGHGMKYGINSLHQIFAYCSKRKEIRHFAVDYRVKELKVLNCKHVYLFDDTYSRSLAYIVMSPYVYGNSFFENVDKILEIMPKNELDSLYAQGNLANYQVMKGNIEQAVKLYQQKPYGFIINPNVTWGEGCIQDIKFFIDLFKEHLDNDYYKFNAQEKMEYFEEVLSRLKESSWMNQ